ncbi:MAG: hypothetical protein V1718_02345 [archaeon]
MFKFTTDKKGADALSVDSKTHDDNTLVSEVRDIRKELDEQIKEMKELSSVTIAAIGKIRKLNADEICTQLFSIDERLKKLDEHAASVDKKLADLEKHPKREEQAIECRHEGRKTAESKAISLSHCSDCGSKQDIIKLPESPLPDVLHHKATDSLAHVIETTMDKVDAKKNDGVSETLRSYENKNIAKPEESGDNIFTKLISKVMPPHKKDSLFAQPKMADREDKGFVHETIINESTKKDFAVPKVPEQAAKVIAENKPVKIEAAEHPIKEEKDVIAKKADVDLLCVDEGELGPKMDEMLSRAKQMLIEKRYSDATEIYLKLSDAYEKNKDNPMVQELRMEIDELYDKISSSLLSNLMGTDTGKKMSIFDQNR